jgi:hypothetical protein
LSRTRRSRWSSSASSRSHGSASHASRSASSSPAVRATRTSGPALIAPSICGRVRSPAPGQGADRPLGIAPPRPRGGARRLKPVDRLSQFRCDGCRRSGTCGKRDTDLSRHFPGSRPTAAPLRHGGCRRTRPPETVARRT